MLQCSLELFCEEEICHFFFSYTDQSMAGPKFKI